MLGSCGWAQIVPDCPAPPPSPCLVFSVSAPSPKHPPPLPLGGHPHWGGRVAHSAPVVEWRRITAFPFPPGRQHRRVGASGGPPSAPPAQGLALPHPRLFPPCTEAPLHHSGTAGRAGGWSACCPPPVKWSPRLDSSPCLRWVRTLPAACLLPLATLLFPLSPPFLFLGGFLHPPMRVEVG